VAAWTSRKDLMIDLIIAAFETDRRIAASGQGMIPVPIDRSSVVLVDDGRRYFEDARRGAIRFFHLRSHRFAEIGFGDRARLTENPGE
jgi:hypothetical protein